MTARFGLKGRLRTSVLNGREIIAQNDWQPNLILDQGLNNIAVTPICDLFKWCAKGTDDTATLEDLTGGSDTYTMTIGDNTITRAAGTRDFTADDVGKLVQFVGGFETTITSFTDATHVEAEPVAASTLTAIKIKLYSVHQMGLFEEVGRTDDYSTVDDENGTETADEVKTFLRTFVFPTEDTDDELVADSNTYSQSGTTVTRVGGTRDFTGDDVGKTLIFATGGQTREIVTFTDAENVEVDESGTVSEQAIRLQGDSGLVEEVAGSNTYSQATTTVTRTAGTRDFTSDDVGKYLYFKDDGTQTKITALLGVSTVTVDSSATVAAQEINLYGFREYNEIGFSHLEERDENINIRVKLSSPVRCYVATPVRGGDQIKVAYEFTLSVSPSANTSVNLGSVFSDPGNLMSVNKQTQCAIETFATSEVLDNGSTDTSFPHLEPYYAGYAALAENNDLIDPLSGIVRNEEVASVAMTNQEYEDGDFYIDAVASWGINDAIGTVWRSLMIFDPTTESSIYCHLFSTNQKKDGEHALTVTFRKAWGRDLS